MKTLYESLLDMDFGKELDERTDIIKKYKAIGIYNASMTAQYIIDRFSKQYKLKWQKSNKKYAIRGINLDEYYVDLSKEQFEEMMYNDSTKPGIYDILHLAKIRPEHITMPDDDSENVWIEDFVDEETGYIIPVLRMTYIDSRYKRDTFKQIYVFIIEGNTFDNKIVMRMSVYGKYIKL